MTIQLPEQGKRLTTIPKVNDAPFVCVHCHNTSFEEQHSVTLPGLVVWMCDLCHLQTFGFFLDDGSVIYTKQQIVPAIEDYAHLGVIVRKRL
jgi:hypothetical protein